MARWILNARQRRTAAELGIVVLGVFIALVAQQAVEALNWRSQVDDARQALKVETSHDLAVYRYRTRMTSCAARRLDEVERWVDSWDDGTPLRLSGPIGRVPGFSVHTTTWEVAQSGSVAAHFPLGERLRYARFYALLRNFAGQAAEEREAWALLNGYSTARRLEHADITQIRGAISRARVHNDLIPTFDAYFDGLVSALGIAPKLRASVDAERERGLCQSILPAGRH